MNDTLTKLRQTRASNSAAAIRILLGLLFLSTGVMKFAVPDLRTAFSGQLTAAGIPFHSLKYVGCSGGGDWRRRTLHLGVSVATR